MKDKIIINLQAHHFKNSRYFDVSNCPVAKGIKDHLNLNHITIKFQLILLNKII